MSAWGAIEKRGDPVTAWEFRERYLVYGMKYSEFYCPFCSIPLVPYLIYSDKEPTKSPHFSARHEEHLHNCDGEPLETDLPERKEPKNHYVPRRMSFPEALIDRPPPRKSASDDKKNAEAAHSPSTAEDVAARRKRAGSLGAATPKAYLTRSIAEARNIEVSKIYQRADEEKWPDQKRREELKATLSNMPMRLQDATNYDDAFRSPSFINWKQPRIYYGSGTASQESDTVVIRSKRDGKLNGEFARFEVAIPPSAVDSASPKSHEVLQELLLSLVTDQQEFKWYAYGTPVVRSGVLVLPLRNLDHLYIKKAYR